MVVGENRDNIFKKKGEDMGAAQSDDAASDYKYE